MTDIVDKLREHLVRMVDIAENRLFEVERLRSGYERLARHIAPDVDAEYIWSHLPEQIIDAGLQLQAYAISEARATGRREGLSEAATIIEEGFERGIERKQDTCAHGKFDWEDCDQCAAAAIRAAMEKEE